MSPMRNERECHAMPWKRAKGNTKIGDVSEWYGVVQGESDAEGPTYPLP